MSKYSVTIGNKENLSSSRVFVIESNSAITAQRSALTHSSILDKKPVSNYYVKSTEIK